MTEKTTTNALVTGGTSGIGEAICAALVERGARVVSCGTNPERVAALDARERTSAIQCDLTEPEDVRALFDHVERTMGRLDLLVCCAGIQRERDVSHGLDLEDVEREIALNLTAPIRLVDGALPWLLESPQPTVVNVTSILALSPKQSAPVYCATKAALASWTTTLRWQLEPQGVRVVELVPPLVETPMTEGRAVDAIPPEEVARELMKALDEPQRTRVAVGKAKVASWLHRVSPGALSRRLRHG